MLLPAPERRGELHFYFAKTLPYNVRLGIAFPLIAAGWFIEYMCFESGPWVIGLALVLAGISLLLVRGFDNTVRKFVASDVWKPVTRAEVERILELNRKQRKWDHAVVDITNPLGLFAFIVVLVSCAGVGYWIIRTGELRPTDRQLTIIGVNMLALLVPFWVTGVRFILKNDQLIIKTKLLLQLHDAFRKSLGKEGETFQYQMQTARVKSGEGELPADLKALVQFSNGPSDFLGVQMQISINSVQGTDYPYFYCVLVARKGFGKLKKNLLPPPPKKVLLEPSRDDEVEIMVIRQQTTKNSGYHTSFTAAQRIFEYALNSARQVIGVAPARV